MHRHSRIFSTTPYACRGMSVASAAQLKANPRPQSVALERPRPVPSAKNWSLPSQSLVKDAQTKGQTHARSPTNRALDNWKQPDQSPVIKRVNLSPSHVSSIPTTTTSSTTAQNKRPQRQWENTKQSPLSEKVRPQNALHVDLSRTGPPKSVLHSSQLPHREGNSQYSISQPPKATQHKDTKHSSPSQQQSGGVSRQSGQGRLSHQRSLPLAQRRSAKSGMTSSRKRKDVYISTTLTVAMLAKLLKVKLDHLLSRMRRVGMTQEASYDYILTSDYAVLLAEELGFNPIVDDEAAFDIHPPPPHPNPQSLPPRPPIVTIMGHVDHGKTTLLDTLRSASVAKGEAGGITQHIGAFSVPVSGQEAQSGPRSITFLDTPGHAAFSAMRARGADVTDIVILVVAADDGIMPQTKEVINLLKKEGSRIQLIVAVNKIDKADADPESVKKALLAEGIQLEEYGGDIPSVHVSGLTGEGLPELVETISAVAEVQELRAEQEGPVYGHILESNFHKGLGPVATVLVQRGSLKVGSQIISGLSQGKVRRMTDSNGKLVQLAVPGMAVTISGWKGLPKAGDDVLEGSEADIKRALANRARKAEMEILHEDIEAINLARRQERDARAEGLDISPVLNNPGPKELKLVIKADVSGSSEALEAALHGIGNKIATTKVISAAVGDITESDVLMAKAANATIIGFSVSVPRSVQGIAAQNGVPIFTSNIIYRLIEDVRSRIIALLPVTVETKVVGEATILQLFDIQLKSKQFMKVAGCRVINGIIEKQKHARLVRAGRVVHEGSLDTMRQLKRDITEARKGMECGLSFKDFSDLQEGDLIQMYEKIEKPGVL